MPARSRFSRLRPLLISVGLAVAVASGGAAAVAPPAAASVAAVPPCWLSPVTGTITDPFRQPPCAWCAGNRGIDFAVGPRVAVRAAASGRVEFVGSVAGVRYVVVRLTNGWRHTYGQLTSTSLALGGVVLAGGVVGRASDTFFFGLRVGDDYADPAPFIGTLRGRPRLIPVDGTPARPAPAPQPRCPSGSVEPETVR
jgi:murein DD-endopeptidase MepM/ murein hydrolase activator NlpD